VQLDTNGVKKERGRGSKKISEKRALSNKAAGTAASHIIVSEDVRTVRKGLHRTERTHVHPRAQNVHPRDCGAVKRKKGVKSAGGGWEAPMSFEVYSA